MAKISSWQPALTGAVLYLRIDLDGQLWNGTAFEDALAANLASYTIAMAEAAGTGFFIGTWPALAIGRYGATIFRRIGGAAAFSDPVVAGGSIDWTGTMVEPVQTGDSFARIGESAGASVSADLAAIQADTNDIQSRLPAALVSGRIDAAVGAMAADTLTAAALAASAVTEIQAGLSTYAGGDTAGTTTLLSRITGAVALASTALSTTIWTNARAGFLDNANVGGPLSSQADVNALNQSASRRIVVAAVGQWERPEAGMSSYTVEIRTYDGDGAAVNADSTPTLTAIGSVTGDLSANLSALNNPATGVYRATYSVATGATVEQVRLDASAVLIASTFTISAYTQVVDLVSATWTTTDASHLTEVFNKLPSKSYLTGTANSDGDVQANEATGNFLGSVASVLALGTQAKLDVNAEADAALSDVGLTTTVTGRIDAAITDRTLAAAAYATSANQATILARLGAFAGTGLNTVLGFFRALIRKDAALTPSDVGGNFDNTTDSTEALRDRGDAAWTTANVSALALETTGQSILAKVTPLPADPAGLAGLAVAHGAGSWATAVLSAEEIRNMIFARAIGGGTFAQAIAAIASEAAGNVVESSNHTTTTLYAFMDDETAVLTSVNTNTTRTVTVV